MPEQASGSLIPQGEMVSLRRNPAAAEGPHDQGQRMFAWCRASVADRRIRFWRICPSRCLRRSKDKQVVPGARSSGNQDVSHRIAIKNFWQPGQAMVRMTSGLRVPEAPESTNPGRSPASRAPTMSVSSRSPTARIC